jgi:membrane dipeptidase
MSLGPYIDRRADPSLWARELGVSDEACRLLLGSDLVDLHVDTEVPARLFGYDPARRHHSWRGGTPFFGHADFPRLLEGGFTGAVWDMATNPLRTRRGRVRQTIANLERAIRRIEAHPEQLRLVRTASDYRRARADGCLALWLGIQGGNAFAERLEDLELIPQDAVCRVTLVHLTTSRLGTTSSPLRLRAGGLTAYGRRFVGALQERRIVVDLAHIHPQGFWDAVRTADPRWPLIASHTGVSGVRPHWRNLDDEQLRAIARSGGVVGIIYHSWFLRAGLGRASCEDVADHLEHVVRVAGEDCAALGSDYDGLIVPPRDLPDPTAHPVLVERLLRRGFTPEQIRKMLGGNWLRVLEAVRP